MKEPAMRFSPTSYVVFSCLLLAATSSSSNDTCDNNKDRRSCKKLKKAGCKWKRGDCSGELDWSNYCSKLFAKKQRKSTAKAIKWCEDQAEQCQLDLTQPEVICVKKLAPESAFEYRWATDPFESCPEECGANEFHQQREVRCEATKDGEVAFPYAESDLCPSHGRPSPRRLCPAKDPCQNEYEWHAAPFRPCPEGCGQSESVVRRMVKCQPHGVPVKGLDIPDDWCTDPKPPSEQKCVATKDCYDAEWLTLPFKPCPSGCGLRPTRLEREVRCVSGPNQQPRPIEDCEHLSMPKDTRLCLATQECRTHRWVAPLFPECKTHCGMTRISHRRDVSCYLFKNDKRSYRTDHNPCHDANQVRPVIEKSCAMTLPCLKFTWEPLDWSGCPTGCGIEWTEKRQLHCRAQDITNNILLGTVPVTRCASTPRPQDHHICPMTKCKTLPPVVPRSIPTTPRPVPVSITDECEDDPKWRHEGVSGESHGCAFYNTPIMAEFCTEYLKDFDLGVDGRWPDEACPRACGVCDREQHGAYHKVSASNVSGHSVMCPTTFGKKNIRYGYTDLSECVGMCNRCDECIGFVDYHEFQRWFCVFKSSEQTIVDADSHKDYYRKAT